MEVVNFGGPSTHSGKDPMVDNIQHHEQLCREITLTQRKAGIPECFTKKLPQ